MTKNKRNAGRKKLPVYDSIYGDYDDTNINKKVMKIPDVITHDIGWELITGMKFTSSSYEQVYLMHKQTPLRREHRYYERKKK